MPIYEAPRSDNARLTFLKRAEKTATQDKEKGNEYVSGETLDEIKNFIPDFEIKLNALMAKLSNRSKELREKDESIELLKTYVRDIWESVKRRAIRKNEPAEVLTFYQLPLSGIVPKPKSREEWVVVASKLIEGDSKAVEAGYEPLVNPSVPELKEVMDKAQKESDDVAIADRIYDKAQEELENLRPQADELISETMEELRFYLRKKDAASRRRIMKTYGAAFKYLKGEPVIEKEELEEAD